MEKIKNTRIKYLDVARGFAIIMVIFGHLNFPYLSTWIYSCHIPLFFFLSGMVFKGDKYTFKEFLIKKAKGILIPYFALGIVIWLFFCGIYFFDKTPPSFISGVIESPLIMLGKFLTQRAYCTIWFLACLFFAELIFYGIKKWVGDKLLLLFVVSFLLCVCALVYYRLGGITLPWNIDTAFTAQFFLCLGYLLANGKKLEKIKNIVAESKWKWKKLLFIGCMLVLNVAFFLLNLKVGYSNLNMSVHIWGIEIFSLCSAIFGSLFVISLAALFEKVSAFVYLGQHTMLVFAWHSRIMIVAFNYIYLALGIFQNNGFWMQCLYSVVTAILILAILLPIDYWLGKGKTKIVLGKG